MAYQQVKEILSHAEHLRKFLSDFASRERDQANNDLLAGLFQEVNKHEAQLEQCLAEYTAETSEDLLATWIQYPGDDELEDAMTSLTAVSEADDEVVLQKLLIAEETLLRVYQQAQEQTSADRLQEMFANLIDLQDHHLRNIANCISEYDEIRRN